MRITACFLIICVLLNVVGCTMPTNAPRLPQGVLIDPGHGGFDGGTVAEDGTLEKHLNLAVALYLHDFLHICGVPVRLTRSTDIGLEEDSSASIHSRKVSDMHRRLAMYDEAQMVISIHQNHFSVPKYHGAQVFYSANRTESAELAECLRSSMVRWVQPDNHRELKAASEDIYLLHHTATPAVLVECGFLSNPEERNKLKTPAYQQQLAFAIAAGYWCFQSEM